MQEGAANSLSSRNTKEQQQNKKNSGAKREESTSANTSAGSVFSHADVHTNQKESGDQGVSGISSSDADAPFFSPEAPLSPLSPTHASGMRGVEETRSADGDEQKGEADLDAVSLTQSTRPPPHKREMRDETRQDGKEEKMEEMEEGSGENKDSRNGRNEGG